MIDLAAANEALQWACIGWLLRWAYRHSTVCHRGPGEQLARLETRMTATEEECERLAKNAHDDRNVIGRVSLWVEALKERVKP